MKLHRNAPLSVEGRRRLVERCQTRPVAHIAAEMGISRACASKWVNRYRRFGDLGLLDSSSTPHAQPRATFGDVIAPIEDMRRTHKWSVTRIVFELNNSGILISRRTVTRHLASLGLSHRKFIDPNGDTNREHRRIVARWPGHMVHVDVKKVGRIPDGGGWRIHGRNSDHARHVARRKKKTERGGYVYLQSAIDGYSRIAYTEALPDEKAATAIAFLHRARAWFTAHGITRIHRIVTDNGACYAPTRSPARSSAHDTNESRHTRPGTTGRWRDTTGSWPKSSSTPAIWNSEDERSAALGVWNIPYNYHRPHGAADGQPPASRLPTGVTNVVASYSRPGSARCCRATPPPRT